MIHVRTTCTVCEGDGYLPDWDNDGEDVDVGSAIRCEECDGTGFVEDRPLKTASKDEP